MILCVGPLANIFSWIDKLSIEEPKSGYYLQHKVCFSIVDSDFEEQAKAIFSDIKINVVTGFKFIGGFIRGSWNDIEK